MEKKYLKLQNGSDVRGVALEGVQGEVVNLTPSICYHIAASFVDFVANKTNKKKEDLVIAVGHDSRLSAEILKEGILKGIKDQEALGYDCHLASTPSLFMSCVLEDVNCDGGIMITASHLPFNRNGMKFFTKEGGLEKADIKQLLLHAIELETNGIVPNIKHEVKDFDLIQAYSANLRKIICEELECKEEDQPLNGMHIVVDASNGAGGFFATQVLQPLGCNIEGSIYLEPDGTFPNHIPNPEDKKAMEAIKKATLDHQADLGIIFDTDVDRAASVSSNGQEINKNALIALMAAILARKNPNSTIVTDSVTSDHLNHFLVNELGLKHHRFKRGYRNVINESIRLNNEGMNSPLAIETSGHGALKENYFLDDGAYMSVKILCEVVRCKKQGMKIEDMISSLKEAKEAKEYRLKINLEEFKDYGFEVLEAFKQFANQQEQFHIVEPNYEGVRILFNDDEVSGWLLIRMSLHDPILPMNIEANEEGGLAIIVERIKPFFTQFEALDCTCL